ncbi:MAG: hypothetical protein M3R63_13010 [Actinomycetota bacterium]|nr:hypothetical protein [Actinomycetota bacterium]
MTSRLLSPSSMSRARNVRTFATALGGLDVDAYATIVESAALPSGLLPGVYEDLPVVPLGELLDDLRPDILGELLVLDRLAGADVDRHSAQRLLRLAWREAPAAYGAFVARAAGDHVEHPHLIDLLKVDDESNNASAWVDRTRSCRHSVVTAADCQRRKFRGDTPTLHPGVQGPGR